MKNLNRKSFFSLLGLSALGLALSSQFSFNKVKSFANSSKKVKIKIHPEAVKRTNKV